MFVSKMRITFLSSVKMATKTLVSSQAFSRNSSSNALDLVKSITLLNKRDLETEITEVTRRTCAKIWTATVDRTLLTHILKIFAGIIHSERLEKPFLVPTSECIRLHEERERCLLYLDASPKKLLGATAERQLLGCHISALLDKGVIMLMDGNDIEQLQSMNIWTTGQSIVMDEEKEKEMLPCLLKFRASLEMVWKEMISKHVAFSNIIKDACEHIINLQQEFSLSKYCGRQLMRQGHCMLKAEFLRGEKVLPAFVLQAVVLMLFTDAKTVSFQDIKDSTGIEDKELKMILQSLACREVGILEKLPKGIEVKENDSFTFSHKFTVALDHLKEGITSLFNYLGRRNFSSNPLPPPPKPIFHCILCSLRPLNAKPPIPKPPKRNPYKTEQKIFSCKGKVTEHYEEDGITMGGSKPMHHYAANYCFYCGNGFDKAKERKMHTYFCVHAVWFHWDLWRIKNGH